MTETTAPEEPTAEAGRVDPVVRPLPCPFCAADLADIGTYDETEEWSWSERYYRHPAVDGCPLSGFEFDGVAYLWNSRPNA